MKIIERGCLKTEYYRIKCRECDSVLEFVTKDIVRNQYQGDYVVCPVCGSFLSVDFADFMGEKPISEDD